MSGDAFFLKGGGSRNYHDMRLFGMSGTSLLISRSLRTYTTNIGSGGVKFLCTLACCGLLWPVIPPLFGVGFHDTGFNDAYMIYVG